MASQQQELDANEPATPFKLDKARERGSVVRSAEVTFAAILLACVACLEGMGPRVLDQSSKALGEALSRAARGGLDAASALALIGHDASALAFVAAPIFFVVWVVATLAGAMQAGGVLSAAPLGPDFSRLNPANGLQQVFALRSLNELWRNVAKIVVIVAAMGAWSAAHLGAMLALAHRTARGDAAEGLRLVASALTLLAAIVLAFAALDWSLNRAAFLRRMRMSRREIRDERKEREGDPRIKSRLRELRLQWLQRSRQLAHVRSADVLLTNPTHYAVALEYRHGEMAAPRVTARGAGELARRMRWLARLHGVPVVENPPLARALFALGDLQPMVPPEHFEAVARILRWVYAVRPPRPAGGRP